MPAHPDGYWTTNVYRDRSIPPHPDAPYDDLRGPEASRFQNVREGLLGLDRVAERVVYLGDAWKWVWEYSLPDSKLIYLHPMRGSLSATLTLTPDETDLLLENGHVSGALRQAIRDGIVAGQFRWCWVDVPDQARVEELLHCLRYRKRVKAKKNGAA